MLLLSLFLFTQSLLNQAIEEKLTAQTARSITYQIELLDSLNSGTLNDLDNQYADKNNILMFRQSPNRSPHCRIVELEAINDLTLDWVFHTASDTTRTSYGVWYGGTGWTGQPLFVRWSDEMMSQFRARSSELTSSFSNQEIIIGSLCGKVYFIDFQSGKGSRQPLEVGNPIKGTPSIDPKLNGALYVGHGIPKKNPFGFTVFDIVSHREIQTQGRDGGALRGWGAFDSSPVAVGQFLFWPGENGSLYKFLRQADGTLKPHSILRYRVNGAESLGIENSMAVNGHIGYFGDNGGNILAVNLSTMRPIWHYDNKDDIDASIVVDTTGSQPYIYVSSEVDKQGDEGVAYLTKLNALTGAEVWQHREECSKKRFADRSLDGGIFATPLLGAGDCSDLIFVNYAINKQARAGELLAIDKHSGQVVVRVVTEGYLWSSPVGVCSRSGRMYLITGDTAGNLYLIEGRTGRVVVKKRVGQNFESSPIVVGNSVVVGSRGREIFKLTLR